MQKIGDEAQEFYESKKLRDFIFAYGEKQMAPFIFLAFKNAGAIAFPEHPTDRAYDQLKETPDREFTRRN